ncbi:MAG: acyl-CoA dehydrogenase [Acidimicrobiales bacterium]|nr:acyl-CoA dehydrogenase [Acidimicrobiales bacterium]
MDFDMPADDDPRRLAVRAWIEAHPDPTNQQLADSGYVVPHWPEPWGLDADPMTQLIISEEMAAADITMPHNAIGIGWAAPVIWIAGTEEQKQRYLPPIFSDEERWCQLFSEPDSGSDLASLATRAVRDGDEYVINGSKIWTSGGHSSRFGILLARTEPDVPKHKGISYFIFPMDAPGVTLSPVIDMTTAHSFNQVFFDDVRIPVDMRLGDEGDGWRLAKATLANERVGLSEGGVLWGSGPSAFDFLDLARRADAGRDPVLRDRLAQLHINATVLKLNQLRTLSAKLAGGTPGPEASIQKIMADELGQEVMGLAKDLAGTDGMLEGSGIPGEVISSRRWGPTEVNFPRGADSQFPDVDPIWHYGYLFSPALTLGGGTFAIQRNIVAEHVLGLPREPNVEQGKTWAETRAASAS